MVDPDRRREILEQVAAGRVTPEEATELLAHLETAPRGAPESSTKAESDSASGPPPRPAGAEAAADPGVQDPSRPAPPADAPPTPATPAAPAAPTRPADPAAAAEPVLPADPVQPAEPAPPTDPGPPPDPARASSARPSGDPEILTIRVRGNCRAVAIVGDAAVRTAVAEGDHTARVDGDVLTIESTLERAQGFAFIRSPGIRNRTMIRTGASHVRPLTVRMNPDLALEAQVDAGSMTITGVRAPIRAHTSAGAVRIEGFQSPIELKVAAGSATATGRMDRGASRIECDAGKVTIRLTPDSSVKVRGRVNLGQLSTPDLVGAGDGTLDIVANLGAVDVAVDDSGRDHAEAAGPA
ncbi:MAG: hypothetical protein QOK43_3074 [Acidimicrobiaceae bacterium]|nr:hypothetical protein [Acidimicrobiaceae bacterium]